MRTDLPSIAPAFVATAHRIGYATVATIGLDGTDPGERAAAWDRFLATPPPAGFDPTIHPDWETAASPTFGVLRLTPIRLRVLPGTLMRTGEGTLLTWAEPVAAAR